jgi:hypothetical protein
LFILCPHMPHTATCIFHKDALQEAVLLGDTRIQTHTHTHTRTRTRTRTHTPRHTRVQPHTQTYTAREKDRERERERERERVCMGGGCTVHKARHVTSVSSSSHVLTSKTHTHSHTNLRTSLGVSGKQTQSSPGRVAKPDLRHSNLS